MPHTRAMLMRSPALRLAPLLAVAAAGGALLLPATPAEAKPKLCEGAVTFAKKGHLVVTYRGVDCREAKRILKDFDRGNLAEPPWRCKIEKKPYSRVSGRLITVSCGYGTGGTSLRSKSHAFVATIRR